MIQNLRTTPTSDLSSSLQHLGSLYSPYKQRLITAIPSPASSVSRLSIQCAVRFRPCIDIHKGKVKQIVGSTIRDLKEDGSTLVTNFETDKSAAEFSNLYKEDRLTGGHVIMIGADPLSRNAAIEAMHAYPGGLQVGGGINSDNALSYIEEGASHVIVTSYVFNNGQMDLERLKDLVHVVGKQRLVLDLSCRRKEGKYAIVTDRWQKFTDVYLDEKVLEFLASYADEFLVHGVDVEGKKLGIDEELVALLGKHSPIPVTYAGGVAVMADLERIKVAGLGRVDVTVGSALDIFASSELAMAVMTVRVPFSLLATMALLLLFVSFSDGQNPKCDTPDQGSNLQVFHVFSPCSPFRPSKPLSWEESVLQMQAKDQVRVQYLASLVAGKSVVPIASGRQIIQSPTYIVRAKIGTPAQTLLLAMDTSNDAAWVPCTGCVGCSSTLFASDKSTSFKTLACQAAQCRQVPNPICSGPVCGFNITYGSSTVAANLGVDNITLATDSVLAYTFGCIQKTTGSSVPPQGLLGLGRGPLSLLSQTQNLYQSTFSYCLPSFKSPNFSGSLRLGPIGQPKRIKYTPLLKNPRRSSLYYVNLVAIRVGRKVVDIPPSALAFNPTTGAGTVIDSGTVFTRLVTPAYIAVRDEFRRRVGNAAVTTLGGFDTCYSVPIVAPTMTFMFTGMNVSLPADNLLIHSTAGSITCLAMAAAPDNVNSVLNVIANLQQQNHRVLFDVPNSRLGVSRELCT